MKKLLFFYLLLVLAGCKKEPEIYCNSYCSNGFVCDSTLNECICPNGKYINDLNLCLPVDTTTMYRAVEANKDCFCFYDFTWLTIDKNFTPYALKYTRDRESNLHYFFGQINLYPNPINPEAWPYLDTFISGTEHLPCKLSDKFVDAHMYIKMKYDTIWIKADIVPYISGDWLHWQEYPVLETCNLMFVKPK